MNKTERADLAYSLYAQILKAKNAETNRAIFLGQTFKNIRIATMSNELDR